MPRPPRRRLRIAIAVGAAVVTLLAAVQFVALVRHLGAVPPDHMREGLATVPALVEQQAPERERTTAVYSGYGTWVDVYDFLPSESSDERPVLTPASVDEMARQGVRTLYLQAAQLDESAPSLLADRALLAQILVRAQRAGMRVVGWYLPKFRDVDRDLAHLQAIADFDVLGHRFDGMAVDIEWTDDVPDPAERSNKLVALSERLRAGVGAEPLGAIVLPPVQLEEVNTEKWPAFPWFRLSGLYDVWLPMSYWTDRKQSSGFRDGQRYTEENVDRLRDNLGDPDAVVHAVGGIGKDVSPRNAEGFARAALATDAIGGSIYDWISLDRDLHQPLARRLNEASRTPH